MLKILSIICVILVFSLGYAIWRVNTLNASNAILEQQKQELVISLNKNSEIIETLKKQRLSDQKNIQNLQKRNSDISKKTSEISEKLRHEKDAPAAPVLRCAINERLCSN